GVSTERRSTHMVANASWVLRFGMAIGWTDDFEDLEHDRSTGHPNRLMATASLEAVQEQASKLVARVEALLGQRSTMAGQHSEFAQLLPLLLSSWLGGPDFDEQSTDHTDASSPDTAEVGLVPGRAMRVALSDRR